MNEKIEYTVPEQLLSEIQRISMQNWPNLTDKKIADSVLYLSDFFIENPDSSTPWEDSKAAMAYLNYYLPLNYLRMSRVLDLGHRLGFFEGLSRLVDFGCGPGTASLAALQLIPNITPLLIELSPKALSYARAFLPNAAYDVKLPEHPRADDLFVASYSLTELDKIPSWMMNYQNLLLVEPSTQIDGRRLMEWRQNLIEAGFHIWAPCTHQLECPLLNQSKSDWCHDRLLFKTWERQKKIESYLPFKNFSLTHSYLLASRRKPTREFSPNSARVIGDLLKEKGKNRQLICRGRDREFLTWMKKSKINQEFNRGDLLKILGGKKVSNEIRVETENDALLDSQ